MRNAFIDFLFDQASKDPNLYLIVGDLGFSVVEKFEAAYGARFINAGIAEQNMIGLAAGLSMAGKNVYVYSIVPFVTMRCFEQIRNDLCYQKLPVKLIGIGAGFDYGTSGVTHHAIEDIAVMRALPEMTIVTPGNKHEAQMLAPHFNNIKGPAYIRISRSDITIDYPKNTIFVIGKALEIIPHDEILVIASGSALDIAVPVQATLAQQGCDVGLVSMPTVKPLDRDFLLSKQKKVKAIFTIEEHSVIGGIGEAISSLIMHEFEHKIIFKSFGINDCYFHEAGSKQYLREKAGLGVEHIAQIISEKIFTRPNHVSPSVTFCPKSQ